MRTRVLAAGLGTLSLALMSTAAWANVPALRGSIDADYSHVDGDQDVNGDEWGANGHVLVPLGDSSFNVQVDGGYGNVHGDGQNTDGWDISGAAFWRGQYGDVGAVISHADFSGDVHENVTAYGAFGELFLGDFTLGARGGWFDGGHSADGEYYGANAKFYIIPDLSFSGGIDQVHISHLGHITDWTAGAEWQVMDRMPLSLFGSYTHSDVSNSSFSFNTYMIGLRWRFGEPGGAPLIAGDRTNVVPNTTINLTNAFEF